MGISPRIVLVSKQELPAKMLEIPVLVKEDTLNRRCHIDNKLYELFIYSVDPKAVTVSRRFLVEYLIDISWDALLQCPRTCLVLETLGEENIRQ